MKIHNDELGVELIIEEDGHTVKSTIAHSESILSNERITQWVQNELEKHEAKDNFEI